MGAEEEAKRKEEEARTKFLEEQRETGKSLKGMEGDSMAIKHGSGFFGIKGNPEGESGRRGALRPPTSHTTVRAVRHTAVHARHARR